MRRRVQRWGNSLAVRIPVDVARACDLAEGTEVEIRSENGKVEITREQSRPKYALADLVRGITKKNKPAVVDSGRPVGREVW